MPKVKLEFDGFNQLTSRLSKLGVDIKPVAERALIESHRIVTEKAASSVSKPNLPAGGKYSSGNTQRSLKRNAEINWTGTEGSVSVGFDISHGGLPSIFMIYGTPRYMKNQQMYDAFYSKRTQNEVISLQQRIYYDEIRKFD